MIIRNAGEEFNIEIDNYVYTLRVSEAIALNLRDKKRPEECGWIPFNEELTKPKSKYQHCHGCFFFNSKTGDCNLTKEQFYITGPCEILLDDVPKYNYFSYDNTININDDCEIGYPRVSFNQMHVFSFVKKVPIESPLVKATKQLINDTTTFFKAIVIKLFIPNKK